jgi:hypothetical protein
VTNVVEHLDGEDLFAALGVSDRIVLITRIERADPRAVPLSPSRFQIIGAASAMAADSNRQGTTSYTSAAVAASALTGLIAKRRTSLLEITTRPDVPRSASDRRALRGLGQRIPVVAGRTSCSCSARSASTNVRALDLPDRSARGTDDQAAVRELAAPRRDDARVVARGGFAVGVNDVAGPAPAGESRAEPGEPIIASRARRSSCLRYRRSVIARQFRCSRAAST